MVSILYCEQCQHLREIGEPRKELGKVLHEPKKGMDISSGLQCRPVKDVLCFGRISFDTCDRDIMT